MRKRKRSANRLRLGSVSEGTHSTIDLLRKFLAAAETINLTREERFAVQAIQRRFNGVRYPEIDADYVDLILILEDHCPDYTMFGVHSGDGADFGVWVDWEAIQHAVQTDDMSKGDTLPTHMKDAPVFHLLVNDHGNTTLYRRAGRRWMEVWAVV